MTTILTSVPMGHPLLHETTWSDAKHQHHSVMDLFGDLGGDTKARSRGQILFRVEPDKQAHDNSLGRVLVQSAVQPNVDDLMSKPIDEFLNKLAEGQRTRVLLRANTVRTINRTNESGQVKQHRARVPESDLLEWLKNKLAGMFEMDHLDQHGGSSNWHYTTRDLRQGGAQLITTDFVFHAPIGDPAKLREAIRTGVGRAKSYGCGLMLVLPTR